VLIEAAWCYRFAAKKSAPLQRRAEQSSAAVQAIAWKAQKRLCARYQHLHRRGLVGVKISTAIARELCGFIWAIAGEVQREQPNIIGARA
ncbi:MAG: IS110 family transposase, partial [Woeseiaceae bacterium]